MGSVPASIGAKFAVVILAGGAGRRIGGDKPHRTLAGRPLIDLACQRARSWSVDVAVAGSIVTDNGQGVPWLADPAGIEGPLAGLASALAFARSARQRAVLTIPCDTPFLPEDLPARLQAAMSPDDRAAVPECGGRLHPACAVWTVEIEPVLLEYAASGRRSLLGLLDRARHVRVGWEGQGIDPFFNINTIDELRQAEAWLSNRDSR